MRVDPLFKRKLEATADALEDDAARIVRDAVNAWIARLCWENKAVALAVEAAKAPPDEATTSAA